MRSASAASRDNALPAPCRSAVAPRRSAAQARDRLGAGWRQTCRAGRREQRRRRFAGLLRFALFLVLVFLAAWAGVRVAHAGTEAAAEGETYVAVAGDSIWQIALEHYGNDIDLRRAVHEIRVANDFSSTRVLQPGDDLVLPSAGDWRAVAYLAGQ